MNNSNLWIIGCGDIGRRVASLYQDDKTIIQGIVQSEESLKACEKLNIKAQRLNFDNALPLDLDAFIDANIFYFMPPPSEGTEDTRLHKFLTKVKHLPQRIILISTTGVYGDSKGAWIDESTPINPIAERALRRASAEKTLSNWAAQFDKAYIILRVPGIYAQDRLPLARLKKGLPVVKESEAGFTNRIHADDLALACKAAMASTISAEIINITDGKPSTMTDYFNQVADYANLPRPPQISMQEAEKTLSAGMISYLKESRRIRNDKMLKLLKIKLKYPDLSSTFKT